MRPMAVPQESWQILNVPLVNAHGASMEMADACCSGLGNLSQRAKPPSAAGDMNAFSYQGSATVRADGQLPVATLRERFARATPVKSGIAQVGVRLLICDCLP